MGDMWAVMFRRGSLPVNDFAVIAGYEVFSKGFCDGTLLHRWIVQAASVLHCFVPVIYCCWLKPVHTPALAVKCGGAEGAPAARFA